MNIMGNVRDCVFFADTALAIAFAVARILCYIIGHGTRLINLTEAARQLQAYAWVGTPSNRFDLKCDLLKSVNAYFCLAGVPPASPQRIIYIEENPTTS
jgi:hypothetical protein